MCLSRIISEIWTKWRQKCSQQLGIVWSTKHWYSLISYHLSQDKRNRNRTIDSVHLQNVDRRRKYRGMRRGHWGHDQRQPAVNQAHKITDWMSLVRSWVQVLCTLLCTVVVVPLDSCHWAVWDRNQHLLPGGFYIDRYRLMLAVLFLVLLNSSLALVSIQC